MPSAPPAPAASQTYQYVTLDHSSGAETALA
ncbi:sulfurtransferase FdhD, partial [Pseudomonas sp. FSL R10-1350]|nr:sulfurtransferase FdhD [Pseudomonas sp. FSL R10-1350]